MQLKDLAFKKRGDLLELAEIMAIKPDSLLEPHQIFQAVAMRVLPTNFSNIDWWSIIKYIDVDKEEPNRWLVTILEPSTDNSIVIIDGYMPFDSEGKPVKFTGKPHTWYTVDIYQYYQDYVNE